MILVAIVGEIHTGTAWRWRACARKMAMHMCGERDRSHVRMMGVRLIRNGIGVQCRLARKVLEGKDHIGELRGIHGGVLVVVVEDGGRLSVVAGGLRILEAGMVKMKMMQMIVLAGGHDSGVRSRHGGPDTLVNRVGRWTVDGGRWQRTGRRPRTPRSDGAC